MKVAVISNNPGQVGKSSFILLLASLFARTQRKQVTVLSTGSLAEMYAQAAIDNRGQESKSINVYSAFIRAAAVSNDSVLDYANRIGSEEVYTLDIFSAAIKLEDMQELFLTTLNAIKTELILVEIAGDINTEFNHTVMNECDVVLNVFNATRQSMEAVKKYTEEYDERVVARTGFVCQKYDAKGLGEKRIASTAGINIRNMMVVPYNTVVIKKCFEGELNTIAKAITEGNSEVISLRIKLLEVMQYLFDSDKYKYIKGPSEWYR